MPYSTTGDRFSEAKFYGKYRGLVKNNADPKKLGRLIVQVPEIFGAQLLTDWAFPTNGSFSGPDKGDFAVPDVGDGVFIEFEAGDSHRPLWSGIWWAEPGGKSEIPDLAQGVADESQESPKGTDSFAIIGGTDIATEPPISYAAKYPFDKVTKTKEGIIVEMDDTPGAVRYQVWHPAKSWIEIHNDGTVVMRSAGGKYEMVVVNDQLHVKGNRNVCVEGDATLHVKGKYTVQADGGIVFQAGDPNDPGSDASLSALSTGDQNIIANGKQTVQALDDQKLFGLTQKIYAGVADMDTGAPPLTMGVQIMAAGFSQQVSVGLPAVVPTASLLYGSRTTTLMGGDTMVMLGDEVTSMVGSKTTVIGAENTTTMAGDETRISGGNILDMANIIIQNP